jgi:type II secretory pathway component PulK
MTQRGFALLAVLWTLTAITAVAGATLAAVRLGEATTRNRVLLARAAWARESCSEILQARYAQYASLRGLDTVELGRGTWCAESLEDPSSKLNINLADRAALATVMHAVVRHQSAADSLVDALLDSRRGGVLADLWELRSVRGFTDTVVTSLAPFLTTRGPGVINVNAAPRAVLSALPGMTEEAVAVIMIRRASSPIPNADVLAGLLSSGSRGVFLASYPEFVRAAVYSAPQLIAVVVGGVRGTPLVARVTLTTVPVAGRLAVIRRESE